MAYTMDGKAMPQQWNLRPVFVQASELLDHHPLEKWFGGILSQLEDALDANEEKGTVNRAVK